MDVDDHHMFGLVFGKLSSKGQCCPHHHAIISVSGNAPVFVHLLYTWTMIIACC